METSQRLAEPSLEPRRRDGVDGVVRGVVEDQHGPDRIRLVRVFVEECRHLIVPDAGLPPVVDPFLHLHVIGSGWRR